MCVRYNMDTIFASFCESESQQVNRRFNRQKDKQRQRMGSLKDGSRRDKSHLKARLCRLTQPGHLGNRCTLGRHNVLEGIFKLLNAMMVSHGTPAKVDTVSIPRKRTLMHLVTSSSGSKVGNTPGRAHRLSVTLGGA